MKIGLLILGLFFSTITYSQIQPGTYELQSDTIRLLGSWSYTRLHLNDNNTFKIEYRTSLSCFLWSDLYGNWTIDKDKLILEDNAVDFNSDKNETVKRKTIYLISNSDLILHEQKTDKFALLPSSRHFGNYRKVGR
jgi:hypothetical protein